MSDSVGRITFASGGHVIGSNQGIVGHEGPEVTEDMLPKTRAKPASISGSGKKVSVEVSSDEIVKAIINSPEVRAFVASIAEAVINRMDTRGYNGKRS